VPKLSKFFGIEISIRTRETPHHRPHFHARYAGEEVSIAIDSLEVLAGLIQQRALGMVMEWAVAHRGELLAAWNEIQAGRVPEKIAPLR
jgi:hypothetical protein